MVAEQAFSSRVSLPTVSAAIGAVAFGVGLLRITHAREGL